MFWTANSQFPGAKFNGHQDRWVVLFTKTNAINELEQIEAQLEALQKRKARLQRTIELCDGYPQTSDVAFGQVVPKENIDHIANEINKHAKD